MRLRTALVALATVRITDTAKESSPVIPPPWFKSLFAAMVAVGLMSLETRRNWRATLIEGFAAAGAAALVHDAQTALVMYADVHRQTVLMRTRGQSPRA